MKIVLPFILLIFGFITKIYSQDIVQEDCLNDDHLPMDIHEFEGDFLHLFREREWFATTPSLVEKAPCRKKRSNAQIISELSKLSKKAPFETIELRGIELKDQNKELIEAFVDLVSKRDILGRLKPEEEQPDLSVAKDCQDIICATRKIFGHSIGPKLLFMRQKFGMNGSDLAHSNSSRLKTNEIDSFIRSLDDLPKHMTPFVKNKKMTRFSRGYTLKSYGEDGGGVLANSTMTFFDGWERKKREGERDYVCTHEIGHVIANEFELDTTPEWLALSDWEDLGDDWEAGKQDNLISNYARTNPSEDFAESVAAYRYNPKLLKENAPQKYDFIKNNVYAGIEYWDENTCSKEAPRLADIKEKIMLLTQEEESALEDVFSEIHKKCAREFNDELNDQNAENKFALDKCAINSFVGDVLSDSGQEQSLQQKSLARHGTHIFLNSPELKKERSLATASARKTMLDQLRGGLVDVLVSRMGGRYEDALEKRDCIKFGELTYDFDGVMDKRFDMILFSHRIKDSIRDFGRRYCELHLQNHGTKKELDDLDLQYVASRFLKDRLQFKKAQWNTVEKLQERRMKLLDDLRNRKTLDDVISWFRSDPLRLELSRVEEQLNKALNEL